MTGFGRKEGCESLSDVPSGRRGTMRRVPVAALFDQVFRGVSRCEMRANALLQLIGAVIENFRDGSARWPDEASRRARRPGDAAWRPDKRRGQERMVNVDNPLG